MTIQQARALRAIGDAIIDAVSKAGAVGAPGGHLYAALMAAGCSYDQFVQIMAGLVRAGMLSKSGECYHVTAIGRATVSR